jgi:hypothetical protein
MKKMKLFSTCSIVLALSSPALADSPQAPNDLPLGLRNGLARETALRRLEQDKSDPTVGPYLRAQVAKFKKLGVVPGPFCLQLRKGCLTQRELGYRSSEYYSLGDIKNLPKIGIYVSMYEGRLASPAAHERFHKIADENGVSGLTLMYALELKEKLGIAYLEQHAAENPNRPNHTWEIDEDGKVFEKEHVWCDDCH